MNRTAIFAEHGAIIRARNEGHIEGWRKGYWAGGIIGVISGAAGTIAFQFFLNWMGR